VAGSEQETYECDALVVGSGCAGMSAAVTAGHHGLNVLIVEKEPRFGGTTARSGGWLWIPSTSLAKAYGIEETPDYIGSPIQELALTRQPVRYRLDKLTPENHHLAVGLANIPEKIRGFGHVKARHLVAAKADEAALLDQFRSGQAPVLKAAE